MAYHGERVFVCAAEARVWPVFVEIVNGGQLNPCGHAILRFGPRTSAVRYHVAGQAIDYPKQLLPAEFDRYCAENAKRVLREIAVDVPDRDAAARQLELQLSRPWCWGILLHNCATFCEQIIAAGGGHWRLFSNCPALAAAHGLRTDLYAQGQRAAAARLS